MMEEVQSIFSVWLTELLRFNVGKTEMSYPSFPFFNAGLPWTNLNGLLTESGSGQKAVQKL